MYFAFTQLFRNYAMQAIIALLIGFVGVAIAQTPIKTPGKALTDLLITDDKGSELQLEVRQMPLAKVLGSIAKKTGVPIHYSVLPEGLVTATCVGSTLKPVLECLLNRKADLIVRYPRGSGKVNKQGQIAEAWILGSRLETAAISHNECTTLAGEAGTLILKHRQEQAEEEKRKDELLKAAQSTDAAQRADAISAILDLGRKGDPEINAVLEQALTDQDANVRAQAISTYAHLEGNEASGAIRQAMQDSSVDVRMMAVDAITDDVAMLQQAVNDSDETIRELALIKLESLTSNKAIKNRK